MGKAVDESGLDKSLVELVKLRVSQIWRASGASLPRRRQVSPFTCSVLPSATATLCAWPAWAQTAGTRKRRTATKRFISRDPVGHNCAFCLQIHLNVARRLGIAAEKIDLIATWEEAGVFSARECAALAWAEALACLPGHSVSDEVHAKARAHFSEDELMWLSVAIANINAWNRLGAAYRFTPPVPRKVPAAA